jgi:NSS family neurotransmitter:Na+ symporter
MSTQRWSTDLGFLLGAVGAAVGLGSIWRFPYLTGAGGGFAFILVFVLACLVFGAPMLIGEAVIGRLARTSPQRAAGTIAERYGFSRSWNIVGWTGPLAGFLVTSYYTMIAGWVLAYTWLFLTGQYARGGVAQTTELFHAIVSNTWAASGWQLSFFAIVTLISARGVNRGLEFTNRWRAPALLLVLLLLVGYSLETGDVVKGLHFAFAPDFSRLTPSVLLDAVGQAFYALGICVGVMMVYGSYMPASEPLGRSVVAVIGSILLVSGLATVVIFPLVFHYGLNPASGPELVFQVLPVAFAEMPGGRAVGSMFFALLVLAALTPTLALMEPWISWLTERFKLTRTVATLIATTTCWLVGQGSVASFGACADWHPLAVIPRVAHMNLFGIVDFASSNVLMPLSTLFVSVFLGWRLGGRVSDIDYGGLSPRQYRMLVFALRYLCPMGILVILSVGLAG